MMKKVPMTKFGFQNLGNELKYLKSVERPSVIDDIVSARALGDLSENAEYHAARERQCFIETRIGDLEDKLSRAHIIDVTKLSGDIIKFGATVTISNKLTKIKRTYKIVGEDESDLKRNRLSLLSPMSRALIGKRVGDVVDVDTPQGDRFYQILSIEYK